MRAACVTWTADPFARARSLRDPDMIAVETVRKGSQTWERNAGIDDASVSTLQQSASRSRSRQSEGPSGFQVSKHVKNFAIVAGYYVVGCVFFCPVEGWSILKVHAPVAIIHQRARALVYPLRRAARRPTALAQ